MGQTREADPEQLYISCCSMGVFCEFVPDLPRLFFHSWLPQNIWGGADAPGQGVCPCFNPSERKKESKTSNVGVLRLRCFGSFSKADVSRPRGAVFLLHTRRFVYPCRNAGTSFSSVNPLSSNLSGQCEDLGIHQAFPILC